MRRSAKWLLIPAVLVAALLFASPKSADAAGVVVRTYYPSYRTAYVYRTPRPIRYYAPAPVVVYPRPTVVYSPLLPRPPVVYRSVVVGY